MQRIICTHFMVAFALASSAQPKTALLATDLATESPFKLALESSISLIAYASAPSVDADAAKEKHAEDYAKLQRLKTEMERLKDVARDARKKADQQQKLAQHNREKMQAKAAYDQAAKKVEEDKSKVAALNMPVSRQIPLVEMAKFIKTLSPECGKHFEKMMDGQNKLHTFGSGYAGATPENCADLGGALCKTDAHVTTQTPPALRNGERDLETEISTEGDSCLPRQCVSATDLHNVAEFMQKQAIAIIPGDKHRVTLSVDCSKYGGSYTTIDSGTALMAPTALVLAALFLLQGVLQ